MNAHTLAQRWWGGELGAAGTVLDFAMAPAEALFRIGAHARNRAFDRGVLRVRRANVPVISVGNIAVGGAGKTPFANWVARQLAALGARPAILHGGYAADEPALHRQWTPSIPVLEDADRAAAAGEAAARGASVLVLDDGFQHRWLHRDLDIVLVAAERWTSAPRLLPRGPWREPPSALRRADLVVVTRKSAGADVARQVLDAVRAVTGREAACVHLKPSGWRSGAGAQTTAPAAAAVLVSGVADPVVLAASASAAGAEVRETLHFPDHHDYTQADAARISAAAGGGPIVTTEKDWVKLQRLVAGGNVFVLVQDVIVEHGEAMVHDALARIAA